MGYFDALKNEQFISLTTYRKNGTPVATPVWFAETNNKLYVLTIINAGKHKRLKNNPQVAVTPCSASGKTHGATLQGRAQIHTAESDMGNFANATLTQKYGWQKRIFDWFHRVRGVVRVYLEIEAV